MYLQRTFMTTAAMKNDMRGGCASKKSTLRYLPANGTPSWGLGLWLSGFKGAAQLQIAMEHGPFACRVFVVLSSHTAAETRGAAQAPLRKCLCAGSHTEPSQWLLGVSTCGLVHLKAEIQPRATGQ